MFNTKELLLALKECQQNTVKLRALFCDVIEQYEYDPNDRVQIKMMENEARIKIMDLARAGDRLSKALAEIAN